LPCNVRGRGTLRCRHVVVGTRFCASATRPDAGRALLDRWSLPREPTAFHCDLAKTSTRERGRGRHDSLPWRGFRHPTVVLSESRLMKVELLLRTSLNNTRCAVDMQTGRFTRWKPDSPAAAWCFFIFFTKMWLTKPHFCEEGCPIPPCRRRYPLPGKGPRKSYE